MLRRSSSVAIVLVLAFPFVGCETRDEISTYSLSRTKAPRPPVDVEQVEQQFDRTLAAIVPHGEQAWFFKLAGPAPAINRQREAFLKFISTIALDKDESAEKPLTWKSPEGWEERGPSEMRLATLVIPDEAGPLELAVSSLPLSGDWEDYLVRNVNRWMGQLSQGELEAATVSELVKEMPVEGGTSTWIELVGSLQQRPGAMSLPPKPDASQAAKEPAEEGADDSGAREREAENAHLGYETPEGWLPGRFSAMRKAAFRAVDGESEAEVTVLDFPATEGSQMADVEANMRRWAGQVGLADFDGEAMKDVVELIEIDGLEGNSAELVGPEDAEFPVAMQVAMVVREGKVWFFKMVGDATLVKGQKEAFRGFLDSVRFK